MAGWSAPPGAGLTSLDKRGPTPTSPSHRLGSLQDRTVWTFKPWTLKKGNKTDHLPETWQIFTKSFPDLSQYQLYIEIQSILTKYTWYLGRFLQGASPPCPNISSTSRCLVCLQSILCTRFLQGAYPPCPNISSASRYKVYEQIYFEPRQVLTWSFPVLSQYQ